MTTNITYKGVIQFNPDNKTNKHNDQAIWKRMALVLIPGDVIEYYSWFIKKRYSLELNKPLRGAHISFVNDSIDDIRKGCCLLNNEDADFVWDNVAKKWDGKEIDITLDLDPRSDTQHWWLNIPNERRDELHAIRAELGLGRPFWGLHMSIGYANDKNKDHSIYIHNLLANFGKSFY